MNAIAWRENIDAVSKVADIARDRTVRPVARALSFVVRIVLPILVAIAQRWLVQKVAGHE